MGSEGHEHEEGEYEDTERDDNNREPNANNEPEYNNNEISSIRDKKYDKWSMEKMWVRKLKCDLPLKMHIQLK